MAIIHDQDGLATVAAGGVQGLAPPCVMQEYVNHGGCLFKVYVVGDVVTSTIRRSLPDLRSAKKSSRRRAKAKAISLAKSIREGPRIRRIFKAVSIAAKKQSKKIKVK